MGRLCVLLTFVLGLSLTSFNGFSRDIEWNRGVVIFNNNERVEADLHLNMELGLLMVKEFSGVRTYPAFKFKYVEYFDDKYGEPRFFVSLTQKRGAFIKDINIFEVVLFGEYLVLRKTLPMLNTGISPFESEMDKIEYTNMDNFEYFVYDGQSITRLRQLNRKRIAILTARYEVAIHNFIQKHQIHCRDNISRIKVIAYYNALAQCKKDGGDC